MDQNDWSTLNQMLGSQSTGQQQYVVQMQGGTRVQRGGRMTNGAATQRIQQSAAARDSDIVKSLLTGSQYGQSILRPELINGSQTQGKARQQQQQSLLLPSWQQQQREVEAADQIAYSDVAQQLGSGGTYLAVMDGVTYQIIDQSGLVGQTEGSVLPFGSGISLEDLANISAEQETLQLDYAQQQQGDAGMGQDGMVQLMDHQQQQQYLQQGATLTTTSDGMQVIVLPEGYEAAQDHRAATELMTTSNATPTIKVGGQDFVLQPGQELPPEIQDMVARGLPIDFSKYELIIQEGDEGMGEGGDAGYAMSDVSQHGMQQQLNQVAAPPPRTIRTNVVSAARPAAPPQQQQRVPQWVDMTGKQSVLKLPARQTPSRVITVSPGELDDGEFAFLVDDAGDENSLETLEVDEQARVIPNSGFLDSFVCFLQGHKLETLSSVANSSVTSRPSMPKYVPDATRRATVLGEQNLGGRTGGYAVEGGGGSMRRGSTRGRPPLNSASRNMLRLAQDEANRERDPSWKPRQDLEKKHGPETPRGRGRGRPRGTHHSTGNIVMQSVVQPAVEQTKQPDVLVHMAPNEPHLFQKGDFVLERKDAYKTEFPIWRIENGKLLQKFDPMRKNDKLLHKSASIYSSWSGEIRINFKAILVETVSATNVAAGRKQEIVVQVVDKYMTQPPDDTLEQHPLMEVFNIYVQSIVSQALDQTFLMTLQQQHEEYYEGPMRQVDQLLEQAKQAMLYEITWTDEFRIMVETYSTYMVAGLRTADTQSLCQAQQDGVTVATRLVKLYGNTYNRDLLAVETDIPLLTAKVTRFNNFCHVMMSYGNSHVEIFSEQSSIEIEVQIGTPSIEYLGIYHALHHYKFLMYRKCVEEVQYMKQTQTKTDRDILSECLQNRIWIQQLFRELTRLLEKYLIIRAEDGEGEDQQTQDQQQLQEQQQQLDQQQLEQQQQQQLEQQQLEQQQQFEQQQLEQQQLEQEQQDLSAHDLNQLHYTAAESELQSFQLKSDESYEQQDAQQVGTEQQHEESMQQGRGVEYSVQQDGVELNEEGSMQQSQPLEQEGIEQTKVEHVAEEEDMEQAAMGQLQ